MSRPLRVEREGALWHVTSRGVERREIFRDRNDRATFIEFLAETVTEAQWRLHAYVLMQNHYHLLVETPKCTLTQGAKLLNESYARHFNWRYERVGHLYQGRFKSICVESDGHLRNMLRYIVLNPVRCGAVASAGDFEWSNYRATAGIIATPQWLEVDWTLAQFHEDQQVARVMYAEFVNDPCGADWRPWEVVSRETDCSQLEEVIEVVCRVFCETRNSLFAKSRRPGRKAAVQLIRETCAMPSVEVGRFLHMNGANVRALESQGRTLERTDPSYRQMIVTARAQLNSRVGSDPTCAT
jgi:REP element-mobilizing transposase RayT